MSSHRQDLAVVATRIRGLLDALPERFRPDIGDSWTALLAEVEAAEPRRRPELIAEWRGRTEADLSARLAHAPLEVS